MPGKQGTRISGGTHEVNYGQNVTLGKQPYEDVFTGTQGKFHKRRSAPSFLKENCCVRACSATTGYPVMWDEAAINVPIAIRKKQQSRARRRRVLFHTCKKVPSAPKDAHY